MSLELRLDYINFFARRPFHDPQHPDEARFETTVIYEPGGKKRYKCEVMGSAGWSEMIALLTREGFTFDSDGDNRDYHASRLLDATDHLEAEAQMRAILVGSDATSVDPTSWWYLDQAGDEQGIAITERRDDDKFYLDIMAMAGSFTADSTSGTIVALHSEADLWHDDVAFIGSQIVVRLRAGNPSDVMAALERIVAIYSEHPARN